MLVDVALFREVFGSVGGGLLLGTFLGLPWGLIIGNLDHFTAAVSLQIFLIFILKILPPHSPLKRLLMSLSWRDGEGPLTDLAG